MQPVKEDGAVTKYQFQIDDEKWHAWKDTVPRSKSLDQRIIELIEADTEGRILDEPPSEGTPRKYFEEVEHPPETEPDPQPKGDPTDVDRDHLRDELAGEGDLLEQRVDAILAMYERLQELGTAENDDLLEAVDVDATRYASAESVWSNMVKGKDTLKSLPGVEPPPKGRTGWRYTGDEI